MKKAYIFLFALSSVLSFAQFGPSVSFTAENQIKYKNLSNQLDSDLNILRHKIKEQKEKIKIQDGSGNYINYQLTKDSICNVYIYNVSKLVPATQLKDFWKVINRRTKRNK